MLEKSVADATDMRWGSDESQVLVSRRQRVVSHRTGASCADERDVRHEGSDVGFDARSDGDVVGDLGQAHCSIVVGSSSTAQSIDARPGLGTARTVAGPRGKPGCDDAADVKAEMMRSTPLESSSPRNFKVTCITSGATHFSPAHGGSYRRIASPTDWRVFTVASGSSIARKHLTTKSRPEYLSPDQVERHSGRP